MKPKLTLSETSFENKKLFVIMHAMRKSYILLLIAFSLLPSLSSCANLKEISKTVLGTSTRGLEDARLDAMVRVFRCEFDECYQTILDMARLDENMRSVNEKGYFNIFQHSRVKGFIVLMGIPGNIDTTEVGVFLTMLDNQSVKVEISSLSTSAKKKVAREIFRELNIKFEEL